VETETWSVCYVVIVLNYLHMGGLLRLASAAVLCSLAVGATHAEESTVLATPPELEKRATDADEAGASAPTVDIEALFILPNELDPKAPHITASNGGFDWESAIGGSLEN